MRPHRRTRGNRRAVPPIPVRRAPGKAAKLARRPEAHATFVGTSRRRRNGECYGDYERWRRPPIGMRKDESFRHWSTAICRYGRSQLRHTAKFAIREHRDIDVLRVTHLLIGICAFTTEVTQSTNHFPQLALHG